MNPLTTLDVLIIPADDRPPHIASLMTSPMTVILPNPVEPYRCGRMPHPEVFMDYIAEGLGPRSWRYHVSPNWFR